MIKLKTFVSIISILALFSFPLMASADVVPWATEQYDVSVEYEYGTGNNFVSDSGVTPSLSVSINEYNVPCVFPAGRYSDAILESTITASSMYTYAGLPGGSCNGAFAESEADFAGTYTAVDLYFQFTYDFVDSSVGPSNSSFRVRVVDTSTSTTLLSEYIIVDNSDTLIVPTLLGHDISVTMVLDAPSVGGIAAGTVNYNMSSVNELPVVPEPISSTLFIVGGAILGFRRFRKPKVQ